MNYEIYTDDNYDKEGNSQAHIATVSSLEEAVKICEDIVAKSVLGCNDTAKSAQKLYETWRFGGTTAFIRGSNAFDPDEYAKKIAMSLKS